MIEIPYADPAALEAHCRPFLRGESLPRTAAELMASRYVAYTLGEVDYLLQTHHPSTREQADRGSIQKWARRADWQGLEIVSTERGEEGDETGEVEFIARFSVDGAPRTHHERSEFRRHQGRWYFLSGDMVTAQPVKRSAPKVGRNDPCPCGSGKKYKKCCGAAR